MYEKNAGAVLNLNVERTACSQRALDNSVFQGCGVVTFHTSIKVTFLTALDQKSECENPSSVAKPTEGRGFKVLNLVFADSRPVSFH